MRFGLLGPLEVHVGPTRLSIDSPKQRALLAVLLFRANQPVPSGEIQRALWGGHPPNSAAASLHNHVTRLRRLFGEGGHARISAVRTGYRIRVQDGELDIGTFTELTRRAGQARAENDWLAVTRHTSEALALWRGVPLAEAPIDALRPEVQQIVAIYVETLEWHFDAALRQGLHEGLVSRLTKAVSEFPLREPFHIQLMETLRRSGGRAEALEVFQRLRRVLVDQLGIEPSTQAQELQRRILSVDAAAATAQAAADRESPVEPALPTRPPAPQRLAEPPAHLPRDLTTFVGRHDELEALLAAVPAAGEPGDPGTETVITITGMPGVGKSAFAIHAAHRLAGGFPDGQIFLSLNGHRPDAHPVSAADALTTGLLQIGVPPERVPAEPSARERLWRSQLAGKRMLLVLDDAVSSEQVRPLLPRTGGSLVLLTSRRRLLVLDDVVPVHLDVLRPREAAELFVAKAGRAELSADGADVGEVVRLCGHLPLAVHLTAARLRQHPAWQAADLLGDLTPVDQRLAAMGTEEVSVTAAFELSYRDLLPDRQRLFRLLSLVPGDDVDVHAAAALGGTEPAAARQALRALEERHLVDEPVRGRYRMHDLTREHARALAALDEPAVREAAVDRLLEYYLHTAARADRRLRPEHGMELTAVAAAPAHAPDLAGEQAARAWLDTELRNLWAAVEYADVHDRPVHVVRLTIALHEFLRGRGMWCAAQELNDLALRAARRVGDERAEAEILLQSGVVQRYRGRWRAWEQDVSRALALLRGLGDVTGQARALRTLGTLRRLSGDYAAGGEDFQRALEMYGGLGDRLGQADVLLQWSHIQRLTGEYATAADNLREALSLYGALHHRRGEANALAQLGELHQLVGRYAEAEDTQRRALELFRSLGHRVNEANSLIDLAVVQWITGKYPDAELALHQAVEIQRDIDAPLGLANALAYLGCVRLATGDPVGAVDYLTEALALCHELRSRMGEAFVLTHLGAAEQALGRFADAQGHLTTALDLFVELDDRAGEAEARIMLGRLALARSAPAEARTQHQRALETADAIGAPLARAQALEGIAESHFEQGRADLGLPFLERSAVIHRRLGDAGLPQVEERLRELKGRRRPLR